MTPTDTVIYVKEKPVASHDVVFRRFRITPLVPWIGRKRPGRLARRTPGGRKKSAVQSVPDLEI
jgi:hypothetical protein